MRNNNWQIKSLAEVCEIIGGNPAPKGDDAFQSVGLPFVKMKDVGRYHLTNNLIDIENRVSPETAKKNRLKLINRGSILLPRSGSVALNHRAILGMDAYMVSHLCALEIKDLASAYNQFLYYYLTTINFSNITKKTTGLDALTFEDLARVKIPLPPLPIQKQIAVILEKADQAKQKRKEANKLTDEFLQSVFIEMFGDPVKNPKGWEVGKIRDISSLVTSGSTPLGGNSNYLSKGIIFIRSQNILMNRIDYSDIVFIDESIHNRMLRTWVKKNDVLFNITGASIGRVAYFEGEDDTANVNQHVCIVRTVKEKVNHIYLTYLISSNSFQSRVISQNAGATRQAFNFEQVKNFDIILPSLPLQQQFAEIVNKTEALKEKQNQSEQELENLFQSLMQKAFKGELVS